MDPTFEQARQQSDQQPWYRQGWPWLVMIPPALGVFGGLSLLFVALNSPNPMVVDDYSRIARYTELRKERDRMAAELQLAAEVTVNAAGPDGSREIEMVIESPHERLPVTLNLALRHPTRAELDREVLLRYDGDAYRGQVEGLGLGRYYLQLEPDSRLWRLTGELGTASPRISLRPPYGDAHMREHQERA